MINLQLSGEGFTPPSVHDFILPSFFGNYTIATKPVLLVTLSLVLISAFFIASARKAAVVPSKLQFAGELVYDFSKMLITSPVTLTAVWVPNKYTVTFKKSAASKVITKSALHSEKLARLAPPKKAGYKFAGWRIGSSKGKAFRFSYQIKKNLNLVAAWKKL